MNHFGVNGGDLSPWLLRAKERAFLGRQLSNPHVQKMGTHDILCVSRIKEENLPHFHGKNSFRGKGSSVSRSEG
jgi:hypothetical protein